MWRQLLTLIRTAFTLARDLEQTRAEINEINKQILDMTLALQRLSDEIRLVSQRENSEREKLALELENALLRAERALPPSSQKAKRAAKKGSKR